jgi:hypothetical protein
MEKGLVVHITLTADEKKDFNAAVKSSDFNKSVFAKKALMRDVNTQNKKSKMFKADEPIKTMGSDTNE